jgi:magnesium transporter
MIKLFHRGQKQVALSPGTVVFHGVPKMDRARISVITYGQETLEERYDISFDKALETVGSDNVTWLNIDGLHDTDMLVRLGESLDVHPLVLEDIVNVTQRPKMEDYEHFIYVVLRMIRWDDTEEKIIAEQFSLLLGEKSVLTFQETAGDVFDPVRERLRKSTSRMRRSGADYLADVLLDAIVDNYFVVMEKINERVEALEEPVSNNPTPELLHEIHQLKRDIIYLRKRIVPVREVIDRLIRSDSPLVGKEVRLFLRDVYDHVINVMDSIEAFRDMLSGLQDLYLSSVSNRMNEVMKVLTIIATIFIPLTFIAGIYGMNFDVMPELKWRWSYLGFWIIILFLGLSMAALFRRKRWL